MPVKRPDMPQLRPAIGGGVLFGDIRGMGKERGVWPRLKTAMNTNNSLSAWRDPETDPPTMTGRILVWIAGIGPHLVNVSDMSYHFWDGQDDTEMTSPDEWGWWTEISPPNAERIRGDADAGKQKNENLVK